MALLVHYNAVFHAAKMCGDTKVANLALSAMHNVEGKAQVAVGDDGVVQSSINKKGQKESGVKQDVGKERQQQVGGTVRGQKRKNYLSTK